MPPRGKRDAPLIHHDQSLAENAVCPQQKTFFEVTRRRHFGQNQYALSMRLPPVPHRWQVSLQEAIRIQKRLAARVRSTPLTAIARLIAGVDVAFVAGYGLAAVVVWEVERGCVVETVVTHARVGFPYVPGLLSFREAPVLLKALRKVRSTPDVLLCDGQGLAHPRRFGLACHLGILTGLPTVGCAKSRLVGTYSEPANYRGAWAPLLDGEELLGAVVRTQRDVKPVFVSIGHLITLEEAIELVVRCATRYRLPEPTRLADKLVRLEKTRWIEARPSGLTFA